MENVIVLFEVTVKNGKMENYLSRAGKLKELLKDAPGFIRVERFSSFATEGKILSMSVWEDEESVSKWRNCMEHRQSQNEGRTEDFIDYTITVLTPVRQYTMNTRKNAPTDSNKYFGVEV